MNRVVDVDRLKFPVSGTAICKDPGKHISFLHPDVYKDLITNIVFLGAPSTGKTTIAEACARHFNTSWMQEYGREYWEKYNIDRRLTPEQLVDIAKGHLDREDQKLLTANKIPLHGYQCNYHLHVFDVLPRICAARACGFGTVSGMPISACIFV